MEYAVLVALVIAALLVMKFYMKRAVQGKLRAASDDIGEQFIPTSTTSTYTFHTSSGRNEVLGTTGQSTSKLTVDEVQTKHGHETVSLATDAKKAF